MPKIDKINDNMYSKITTGADFNRALGILKDTIIVVDSGMIESGIIPVGFRYVMAVHELEVYLNGVLLRCRDIVNGVYYGHYNESTNFTIQMVEPYPADFVEGALIRFRVTAANYKITVEEEEEPAWDPSVIEAQIADLQNQLNNCRNMVLQVGHDSFGQNYAFPATPSGTIRTIGLILDGDTHPNLTNYRVWETQNSADTSILGFTGICEDQRIVIVNDDHTTFIHDPNSLVLGDGNDITGRVGEVFQFIYDGTVWRQYGYAGKAAAGMQKWKQTSGTFTATPTSTSTLSMLSDQTTNIVTGMALKYKIGSNYYYGIVDAISPSVLTINGAPFTSDVTELYYDESLTKVIQIVIPVEGYYETEDDSALIQNYLGYYLPWSKQSSYCVKYSVISKIADSGSPKCYIQVKLNGNYLCTANSQKGLVITDALTYYTTDVNINTTNYYIEYERNIDLSVTSGEVGDAMDLTAILTFVCP